MNGPLHWGCAAAWPTPGGWGRGASRGALARSAAPLPERLRPRSRPPLGILKAAGDLRARGAWFPRRSRAPGEPPARARGRVAYWTRGTWRAGSREGAGRRPSLSGTDCWLLLPQSALASAAAGTGKRSGQSPCGGPGERSLGTAVAAKLRQSSGSLPDRLSSPLSRGSDSASSPSRGVRKQQVAKLSVRSPPPILPVGTRVVWGGAGPARRAHGQEKFYLRLRPGARPPLTFGDRQGSWTARGRGGGAG